MCHVLIIEDDALLALDIESLLQMNGATSFSFATTAKQAICEARAQRPSLITADVRLRDGTGPHAVEAITRELGLVPTIFITGTPEECEPCPAPHRVYEKPVADQDLVSAFLEMAFVA